MDLSLASVLDPARSVDPARYAIADQAPREALRPVTAAEVGEVLGAAARERLAVVPWGGGVSLPHCASPGRYDLALDLTALDRIVEYEPEDLTLTAECGITIATLRATLAARGQELPIEAAHAGRATLGGALAANASGPRRYRFGAPRDRILGARFALGDGTLARSGGRVVKNVAGYGLHRLLCGSRGGLGVFLEASLKLVPAPERRTMLFFGAGADSIADPARWAGLPRLEPAFVTVLGREAAAPLHGSDQAFTVVVGLEDDMAWVERQVATLVTMLGSPAVTLEGADVEHLTQTLADLEHRAPGGLTFTTAANTPAALRPMLADPAAPGLVFHAGAGRLHVHPSIERSGPLLRELAGAGFQLVDAGARNDVPPTLPAELSVVELRKRIRGALDPAQVLAYGERWARGQEGAPLSRRP